MNRLRSILLALPVALSAQVSTFPPASSTPGGDAVGGASNLTTPGGVPFVNTSGVLNIDATKLFWNNTTKVLSVASQQVDGQFTIAKAGTVLTDNSPFLFETIADPANANTTALYLYPKDTNSHRMYFGKATRGFYALNFTNVSGFENIPVQLFAAGTSSDGWSLNGRNGIAIGNAGTNADLALVAGMNNAGYITGFQGTAATRSIRFKSWAADADTTTPVANYLFDTNVLNTTLAHTLWRANGTTVATMNSGGDWNIRRLQLRTASGATCDASGRFTFEATAGGAGVADTVKVCTKDATDTYSMVPLGGGTTIDASQIVSGQIAKARQNNQTVYADQNITYSTNSDQDMRLGNLRVPSGLFSAIPTASLYSGGYYVITDGNGVNCSAGGGSTATACFSNGTSWVLISGTNATANPTVTFTSQTSVTFTHNLSTDTPIIQCYDASGTRLMVEPSQIASTSTSVSTITFATSQSGKCVANATGGGGGGGGSGTVTSVAMTVPSWLSVSGSPITSSGTLAVTMPSASAARAAILPSYTGNGGKCAAVNAGATDIEYITCSGGGGGIPGGSSGQIQYNSSGSFAGATVGNGLTLASGTLSVDVATVPEFLTASATLNFGVIATATCGEQTITLTGAASQDGIFLGPPADLDAGLTATVYISATNTATVRLCKITSGSTSSINKNFRVTVVRGR